MLLRPCLRNHNNRIEVLTLHNSSSPLCCAISTWHMWKTRAESIPDRTCYAFQPQHVLAQQTHHRSWNPAGARLSVFISASSDVLSECGVITRINKQQSSWQTTNPLVCHVLGGLVLFVFVWRCHSFLIGSVCPLLSLSYRVLYVISSVWAANWIPDLLDLNVDSRHDRPEIL